MKTFEDDEPPEEIIELDKRRICVIYKYYGPPGTGKTHRLISQAKAYVRIGTPLHNIGYFAFTRKAAKEARERMPIDDKELEHFQTLHSCIQYSWTTRREYHAAISL